MCKWVNPKEPESSVEENELYWKVKKKSCNQSCKKINFFVGDLSGGYYLSPCIMTNCHDKLTVCQEEIFGSVATILPFDTEDEVIGRANQTEFGLGG